jgi:hypothetical protein
MEDLDERNAELLNSACQLDDVSTLQNALGGPPSYYNVDQMKLPGDVSTLG